MLITFLVQLGRDLFLARMMLQHEWFTRVLQHPSDTRVFKIIIRVRKSQFNIQNYWEFIIFFLILIFWELVQARLFTRNPRTFARARPSKKLASRLGRRAAPAGLRGGERAARNLIYSLSAEILLTPCGDQSACAKTRPRPPPRYSLVFRFFEAHSASALRRRQTSWSSPGSRLLANSDSVAMGTKSPGPCPVRTPVQARARRG